MEALRKEVVLATRAIEAEEATSHTINSSLIRHKQPVFNPKIALAVTFKATQVVAEVSKAPTQTRPAWPQERQPIPTPTLAPPR